MNLERPELNDLMVCKKSNPEWELKVGDRYTVDRFQGNDMLVLKLYGVHNVETLLGVDTDVWQTYFDVVTRQPTFEQVKLFLSTPENFLNLKELDFEHLMKDLHERFQEWQEREWG